MAKLEKNDVLKLAQLAKLQLTDEEVARYQKEIATILEYVEHLQSVDLASLEPTYQVTGLTNVMRADAVVDYGVSPSELLKNVPDIQDGHIKVRKVL